MSSLVDRARFGRIFFGKFFGFFIGIRAFTIRGFGIRGGYATLAMN
jgi:hypothetical protein